MVSRLPLPLTIRSIEIGSPSSTSVLLDEAVSLKLPTAFSKPNGAFGGSSIDSISSLGT